MKNAVIHYLCHDGFIMETASNILIFDYYKDNNKIGTRSLKSGVIPTEVFNTEKAVYVFVTHSHEDHYNPIILNWKNINNNIQYILSSDINLKDSSPNYRIISEGETMELPNIFIKALGSTDAGVSFLIKVDNLVIFHAGDLNWWHWFDESNECNENMAKDFKDKINVLKGENIDIAFFPVDPRLKEHYYLGGEYFIKNFAPKMFIPMHFWNDINIIKNFAEKYKRDTTEIVVINERGQEILY